MSTKQSVEWKWAEQAPLPEADRILVQRDDIAFAEIPREWAIYVEETIRCLRREGRIEEFDKHAHVRERRR